MHAHTHTHTNTHTNKHTNEYTHTNTHNTYTLVLFQYTLLILTFRKVLLFDS